MQMFPKVIATQQKQLIIVRKEKNMFQNNVAILCSTARSRDTPRDPIRCKIGV